MSKEREYRYCETTKHLEKVKLLWDNIENLEICEECLR